jgi:hypothetical protein
MKTPLCPFLKKPCIEHDCMMYVHIAMTDPQTGRDKDEWTCCIPLTAILQVEGARQTRGVQAAVENLRNEVVKRQDVLNEVALRPRLRPGPGAIRRLEEGGDDD